MKLGMMNRSLVWAAIGGLGLFLVVGFFAGIGFWEWQRPWRVDDTASRDALRIEAMEQILGETRLHAASATHSDSFAMATGPIDSAVEGLFILDFVSGDLQCIVLNFRTAKFNSFFKANVIRDLGLEGAEKRPSYLMNTGMINFPRGASTSRPGNSVVYVLDTTSGAYAAYTIPWRRELASTARPQMAPMMLLDAGRARTAAIRE